MTIQVIKPGLLSTIQDTGRYGYQRFGVSPGGAMDLFSLRVANILVGNAEDEAAIEMTLIAPTLQFTEDAVIAICGADLSPRINNHPIENWRCVTIKKEAILSFGDCKTGCRAYLAVLGGFDIDPVMNSRSTYLRAKFGGLDGRALQKNDDLRLRRNITMQRDREANERGFFYLSQQLSQSLIPTYHSEIGVRVLSGHEEARFIATSVKNFFSQSYQVTPNSDRMAYRLQGAKLILAKNEEMLSTAVGFGTIQVAHEGQPIVLLADRQTVGGYPRITQVISADLPLLGQLKPGDYVSFNKITLPEAQNLWLMQENQIQKIKQAL